EVGAHQPGLLDELELALDVGVEAHEHQALAAALPAIGAADAQHAVAVGDLEPARLAGLEAVARIGAPDVRTEGTAQTRRVLAAEEEIVVGAALGLPPAPCRARVAVRRVAVRRARRVGEA